MHKAVSIPNLHSKVLSESVNNPYSLVYGVKNKSKTCPATSVILYIIVFSRLLDTSLFKIQRYNRIRVYNAILPILQYFDACPNE